MGPREGDILKDGDAAASAQAVYTDPLLAADFIRQTGLDALACSFGTVHGLYRGEPHLSFDVLEQVRENAAVPLVMHGGSGVSDEDYRHAIRAGIRKINYYTYGAKFAGEAASAIVRKKAEEGSVAYWHDLTVPAYERLRTDAMSVMRVFAGQIPAKAAGDDPTESGEA